MKAGTRNLVVALAALAAAAVLPSSASAAVASPVSAVFLKEYSKPTYTINQGDILPFENRDPFFSHGVLGGGFISPTTVFGGSRLVRGAPFLPAGSYGFGDPAHPEMSATLVVTTSGAPLPPDVAEPSAGLTILGTTAKRVAKGGKVKVRIAPSEPVDVTVSAVAGKKVLASAAPLAIATPLPTVVTIVLPPAARGGFRDRGVISVRAKVTDAAGNTTKIAKSRKLPRGKRK